MVGRQNQPAAVAVPISCSDPAMGLKWETGSRGESLPATKQGNQGPRSQSPLGNVQSGTREPLCPNPAPQQYSCWLPACEPQTEKNLGQFCEVQAMSSSTPRTHPGLLSGSSLTLASVSPLVRCEGTLPGPSLYQGYHEERKIRYLKNHQLFENTKGAKEMYTIAGCQSPQGP